MGTLYIVLCKHRRLPKNLWRPVTNGIFTEQRLAENFIECQSASEPDYIFVYVTGPITNPVEMAAQELLMGSF